MPDRDLTISWCGDIERAGELAAFFAGHVGPAYVSHSELQGGRALGPGRWRDDLPAVLEAELRARLRQAGVGAPGRSGQAVLVAELDGELVGLSIVTFAGQAPVPFAVVEDMIVSPAMRSRGIGKAMLDWIATEARSRTIARLFLESGIDNKRAHHLFEQEGFRTVSVVMMRSL
ncbi:GNAT family N-acetyltransferase [Bradyrhizobium ontarionense]|uniref:GNAT family N-acetyltransferase n=1 Tax=Bradyrhizobium ontarionense TaxID=2898149 RepID=A0ABY3R863_9BRAD|nr:GNAT family N-acetyltransferase [Bradyrhizobium sp. A19]UFZ02977.1 GNAT family N-acetyltransferase [Bradyrhizobium sp. A19]